MYNTIENRKIRIAIVGCGRIAKNYFGSIAQYPEDFELVAVCDVDEVAYQPDVVDKVYTRDLFGKD
jgi:UDP-N-acetyl-2-amino-2-deoxyglucuronate dehydrogenase